MLGNTVYTYTPYSGSFHYLLNDLGGLDTLVLSGYGVGYNLRVDLRPGSLSTIAQGQWLTTSTGYNSLIENLLSGAGNDTLIGNEVVNVINSGDGNDQVWGEGGNDTIDGWNGHDSLYGGNGNDGLMGSTGYDVLSGGSGNDALIGNFGQDTLYGGSGADFFIFYDMTSRDSKGIYWFANQESNVSAPDYIVGFDNPGSGRGDIIDFSYVDAFVGGNRDALKFGGHAGYSNANGGPGNFCLTEENGNTVIYGNIGMGYYEVEPDFKIVIVDGATSYTQYNQFDFGV